MTRANKLKQLIQIAKKDLQLDDGTYRQILETQTGKISTKKMTITQLDAVLKHLKSKGFKVKSTKAGKLKQADDPQSKKIRSLWLQLHDAGAVRNPSELALAKYVKRQTGVSALQFLNTDTASQVIESLKKWLARVQKSDTK